MFRFIRPSSRQFLTTPASDEQVRSGGEATRTLRSDYLRWSRLGLGAVGLVAALFGLLVGIGLPLSGFALTPEDIVIAVGGALVGLVGIWLLVSLHRSGRALGKALAWWTAEPYRRDTELRSAGGWLQARTVNFEPPVFARIVTASLTGLLGIFAVSLMWFPGKPGQLDLKPAAIAMGIVCLATAAGQLGGVMRLVSGLAEADPLWVRIRDSFRRK